MFTFLTLALLTDRNRLLSKKESFLNLPDSRTILYIEEIYMMKYATANKIPTTISSA